MNSYPKKLPFLCILCCMVCSQASLAARKRLEKDGQLSVTQTQRVIAKVQGQSNLSLDFTQKIYKSLRKRNIENYGKVYFKKPSYFRWVFRRPQREEWVYNGKSLFHFFPKKSYAHKYSAKAKRGKELRELVDLVLNFQALLKDYKIKSSVQTIESLNIVLLPKKKLDVEKVALDVNKKKSILEKLILYFVDGNITTFEFSNPVTSKLVPSTFSLPAKTKVSEAI